MLAFPLLLWPALRIGPLGVAAAVAALALISIHGTSLGYGPFADPGYGAEFKDLLLQVFIGVTAATAHVLAVVTVERRSALTRLTAFNTELNKHGQAIGAWESDIGQLSTVVRRVLYRTAIAQT